MYYMYIKIQNATSVRKTLRVILNDFLVTYKAFILGFQNKHEEDLTTLKYL